MKNILITTAYFTEDGFEDDMVVIKNPYKRKLTEDETLDLIEKYQPVGMIAGVEPLTRKVLEKAKNLKVVSRCGIGLDSVDLEAAEEMDIKVTITPDAPTESVAELTVGLILCLLRKIMLQDRHIREGGWKSEGGQLLARKTVGLVGCGRIGSYVAKLLNEFGCTLIGYDPLVHNHEVCSMVSLDELFSTSDIVSLHIPYTAENRHIVNSERLKMMKPSSYLVNAARGGIVDEEALYTLLKEGSIAGAAIDCFSKEPYDGNLIELDNIIVTPHTGSDAMEGRKKMEREAVTNLLEALKES